MVKNFLPENVTISSFFLPLYNSDEDKTTAILLKIGKDIQNVNGDVKITADLQELAEKSSGVSGSWEIEVVEAKYFRFLSNN